MKEKDYKKLTGLYKSYFEIFSLKMADKYDANPFKLKFNQELFSIIYLDQVNKVVKNKHHYEALLPTIFDQTEKDVFVKSKDGVSEQSIYNSFDESSVLMTPYDKESEGYLYKHVVIKLICTTLSLNESEIEFIRTSIPSTYDEDTASLVIAVATLPVYGKYPTEELADRWAKEVAKKQVSIFYKKVFKQSTLKFNLMFYIDNINLLYLH